MATIRQKLEALEHAVATLRARSAERASRPPRHIKHEAAVLAGILREHEAALSKPVDQLTPYDKRVLVIAPQIAAILDSAAQRRGTV